MRDRMGPLVGARVLITRPEGQAALLCCSIRKLGGLPLLFPILEIVPVLGGPPPVEADIMIFTSPNAVSFFVTAQPPPTLTLPHKGGGDKKVLAIGPGTQKALEQHGLQVTVEPSVPYNSEALLRLPCLQTVHHQKIIIVKGEGGRTHLAEGLQKRGALVTELAVYKRQETSGDLQAFWKEHLPQIIMTTSNEILQSLYNRMGKMSVLFKTPLIVTSKRAMLLAKQLGFESILDVPFYDDERLVEVIADWYKERA